MPTPERRHGTLESRITLCRQLNDAQMRLLRELEYFGWELKFVRRPPLRDPLPVVFAGERNYVVLRADGTLDEHPDIDVRH